MKRKESGLDEDRVFYQGRVKEKIEFLDPEML